jgi:hypothetical protein
MAPPYVTTPGGLDIDDLSAAKLWAQLDAPARRLAAEALYRHDWGGQPARREADAAVAQAMRFRETAVRQLPVPRRAECLARSVRPTDSLAGSLLLALHLEHRKPLLAAFLDSLGIPHDEGLIRSDHEPVAPDPAALEAAAETLFRTFPRTEVQVYLATLLVMDRGVWGGVEAVLQRSGDA